MTLVTFASKSTNIEIISEESFQWITCEKMSSII